MYETTERQIAQALGRYQVVSVYQAIKPRSRERKEVLKQLAARSWCDAMGEPLEVTEELIRIWVRRYRRLGLGGLQQGGSLSGKRGRRLSPENLEHVCELVEAGTRAPSVQSFERRNGGHE
jgi:transposase